MNPDTLHLVVPLATFLASFYRPTPLAAAAAAAASLAFVQFYEEKVQSEKYSLYWLGILQCGIYAWFGMSVGQEYVTGQSAAYLPPLLAAILSKVAVDGLGSWAGK